MVSGLSHGEDCPNMKIYIHALKEKRMKLEPFGNTGNFCGIQRVSYGY
jgi:hypothetical protein